MPLSTLTWKKGKRDNIWGRSAIAANLLISRKGRVKGDRTRRKSEYVLGFPPGRRDDYAKQQQLISLKHRGREYQVGRYGVKERRRRGNTENGRGEEVIFYLHMQWLISRKGGFRIAELNHIFLVSRTSPGNQC